jgi:hypothetical protein
MHHFITNNPEARVCCAKPVRIVLATALMVLAAFQDSQALTKRKFDFVVGVDGDFKAAMAAAKKASGRFVMFFPDGEYNIGALTGDANQMTTFTSPNVSFIGQSEDKTILFNKSPNEGISITATLNFSGADNLYMQDMTIKNNGTYNSGGANRHVALCERSNKMIYKNVRLISTQDTYYTRGTRTYWEGGQIHGTTDFICGNGDVFFHKVLLWVLKKSAVTAPNTTTPWGYVFNECTIDGTASDFNLGRSWGTARAAFIKTTMKKLPAPGGWGNDMNSAPQLFAEYKSVTATGTPVDMSKRVKSTILTDAAAAKFTVANVLGGTDNWQPQIATQQLAAPVVTREGSLVKWNDDPKALCWAVFRNGKFLASVTTNSYTVAGLSASDVVTVRAANEMGGLGPSSGGTALSRAIYAPSTRHRISSDGRSISFHGRDLSGLTVSLHRPDGSPVESVRLWVDGAGTTARASLEIPAHGIHVLRYSTAEAKWAGSVFFAGSTRP